MRARSPVVEILYFDGCPNHDGALALVERVAGELELDPKILLVSVPDPATAERLRFLGSPTVRVYVLVEIAVLQRQALERGFAGQPPEMWVRDALLREAGTVA